MFAKRNSAFTLLELAIVLVIIALLSGGIMISRELIKTAEMNAIYKQIQEYESARINFEIKYHCLAGDCADGITTGLGSNGNGNGQLDVYTVSNELYQYWQHLGNAGMITGKYTGVGGPGPDNHDYVIGTNIPAAVRRDVGIGVFQFVPYYNEWKNRLGKQELANTHFYVVGRDSQTYDEGIWNGAFTIGELQGLDRKFDDGLANNGRIRTHQGGSWLGTVGCTLPIVAPTDIDISPDYTYGTDSKALCSMWYLFWP